MGGSNGATQLSALGAVSSLGRVRFRRFHCTLAHEHYNVTFEPCAVVRKEQKPGRFSSRDERHERHLYAMGSDDVAIDVTPLAGRALQHSQFFETRVGNFSV